MCNPLAITTFSSILSTGIGIGTSVVQYNQNQKNNEYQTQVALNEIEETKNKAKSEQQEGIEQARDKKLQSIKDINLAISNNASKGFDVNSMSNVLSYEDTATIADEQAQDIISKYNESANNYMKSAQSQLNNLIQTNNSFNSSQNALLLTSLGNTTKVAKNWYTNSGGNNVHI